MTIGPVGTQVVEVLRRAESLFGTAGDLPDLTAVGAAAETGETIAATAAEASGAGAGAHAAVRAEAVRRLAAAADTDTRLGEQLAELAGAHASAAADARGLRESAEAVVRQQDSAGGADTLAALRVLRAQVAAMQRLVAEQSAGAAAAAERVAALRYPDD